MTDDPRLLVRLGEQRERVRKREQVPLHERVRNVLERASKVGNVGALALDRDRVSAGKSSSRIPTGGADPDVDAEIRRLYLHTAKVEQLLDSYERRPVSADYAGEHGEDKTRRLVEEFEGIPSEEVVLIDPSFGSVRAVERARVHAGRVPETGLTETALQALVRRLRAENAGWSQRDIADSAGCSQSTVHRILRETA